MDALSGHAVIASSDDDQSLHQSRARAVGHRGDLDGQLLKSAQGTGWFREIGLPRKRRCRDCGARRHDPRARILDEAIGAKFGVHRSFLIGRQRA
jgi:hypothetical protein